MAKGCVFITGLSASGKSTLAENLYRKVSQSFNLDCVSIDGEFIRKRLESQGLFYGHSAKDREKVALEIALFAASCLKQGQFPIISSICPQSKVRQKMREIASPMFEVFLSCPVSVCAERDYKGHYAKAFKNEISDMVGVHLDYETHDVDLSLETDKLLPDQLCDILIEKVAARFNLARVRPDLGQ